MTTVSQLHGQHRIPFERIRRAGSPGLLQPIPVLQDPIDNANILLNKQIVTMNRAGSNRGNPMLRGLGLQLTHYMDEADRVTGLNIYQDRTALGANLLSTVTLAAPFAAAQIHPLGLGISKSDAVGVKNFVRWTTENGATESVFFVRNFQKDIVAIAGLPALDDLLVPVQIQVTIVDLTRAFLDVVIDFMPSWGDEFGVVHNAKSPQLDPGFKKAYGGAQFVSFFDTSTAIEGVGVQVNPVTEAVINDQHVIQVENTAGVKLITVRFRSKLTSTFFVDVPIAIEVLPPPTALCNPPVSELCGEMLLLKDQLLLTNLQDKASVPAIQDVAGTPGIPVDRDLIYLSINMAIVGGTTEIRVRKFKYIASPTDLGGVKLVQIGTDLDFLPLTTAAATPAPGPPYGTPVRATVAFDRLADLALQVAFYAVMGKDQQLSSDPFLFPGPSSRDICLINVGGTGGGDECVYV